MLLRKVKYGVQLYIKNVFLLHSRISFQVKSIQPIYSSTYNIYFYFSDRDEGWVELIENIEETLKKDLKIISELSLTNFTTIAKQIEAFHAIDGYETLIMKWMKKGTKMHS